MLQLMMALTMLSQVEHGTLPGYIPDALILPKPPADPPGPLNYAQVADSVQATNWTVKDLKVRRALPSDHPAYLSAHDAFFRRYVWLPPWMTVDDLRVHVLAVNQAVSHSSVIVQPEVLEGGWLVAWDLRKLAPDRGDGHENLALKNLLIVWNSLHVQEPFFHAEVPAVLGGSVQCAPFIFKDGHTYHGRSFVPAPHVLPGYALLEAETFSFAPLVRADDFLRRASSTIEGGLYYHFMGFIVNGKRLTEKEIFESVGLSTALSRKVDGDDRAGMFQSAVTGSPRTVERVQGAIGDARITYDVFITDTSPKRHPIYQLLDIVNNARGKEIIFERANGLFGYLLTDGVGNLVDKGPQDLVTDHLSPGPHPANLYPMISCVRCHAAAGGVQVVRNDVPALLSGGPGDIDYFDDLKSPEDRFSTVDRITGLYAAGDKFQQDLEDSRNRYADAVFAATKGMRAKPDEKVVEKASTLMAAQFARYWYARSFVEGTVNADVAALELGYRVSPGQGARVIRRLMPARRVDLLIDGRPVEFADPSIGALKQNMTIRRQDWNRVFPYAAYQAQQDKKVNP